MTIVEPIQVSEAFRKDGYSEELLQRMLVDTLSELYTVAKGVTPATADKVLSEFKLPEISVPGTGLSLSQIFEFARPLLKRDSSVDGGVIGAPDDFSIVLTLRDTHGETVAIPPTTASKEAAAHGMNETRIDRAAEIVFVNEALRHAAMEILEHQSPLLHAANLLQIQQHECFEKADCDFKSVREKYDRIAAGGGGTSGGATDNVAWALLALSKLDTLRNDYEGAIKHARSIVTHSKRDRSWEKVRPWAYYNWGVALNDLGCYRAAADVLRMAVGENKAYAPAHNALARAYIALTESDGLGESKPTASDYGAAAVAAATEAVNLDPSYQEAYVNLGDALRLSVVASTSSHTKSAPDNNDELKRAYEAFEKATDLNVESAGRAQQQLALMPGYSPKDVTELITKKRPECRADLARSLLEAWGCSEAEIGAAASQKNGFTSIGLTGGGKATSVCRNPELLLPGTSPAVKPQGNGARIATMEADAGAVSSSDDAPLSGHIRKVVLRAERDPT